MDLLEEEILKEIMAEARKQGLVNEEGIPKPAKPNIPECLTLQEFQQILESEEAVGQEFQFHSIIYISDVEDSPDVRSFRAHITDVVFGLKHGWTIKIADDSGKQEQLFRDDYLTQERMLNPLPFRETWRVRYV